MTVTYTPYWWEHMTWPTNQTTPLPERCDVVVVGGGYAGLSAALTLARSGRSVQVLDADVPGRAASSRSGGIGSAHLHVSLPAMQRQFGREQGLAMFTETALAREDLRLFIEEENIDCQFKLVGRFTGAMTLGHYDRLGREADWLRRELGVDCHMLPKAQQHQEIGSDLYHGGLVRNDMGGLHPGLLYQAMNIRAREAGAVIHAHTPVTHITREKDDFAIRTPRGSVTSRNVIVCTNGYTGSGLPWLRRRLVPLASQMIATAPLPAGLMDELIPNRRMLGETRRMFHYFRPSPDETRILLGGRTLGNLPVDGPADFDHLTRELWRIFPQLTRIPVTHSWWGYVAFSRDHMPHLACHDGIHYATGFNGSGVVWARWFGKKAAERILGAPGSVSAYQDRSFAPIPFYDGGHRWFLGPAMAWKRMLDWLGL